MFVKMSVIFEKLLRVATFLQQSLVDRLHAAEGHVDLPAELSRVGNPDGQAALTANVDLQ